MTNSSKTVLLGGIVAVSVGLMARAVVIGEKRLLSHDDGISVLAATGHEPEYSTVTTSKGGIYAHWSTGDEWRRFIRVERPFCFQTIGEGLARTDIHPPLYFWVLHILYVLLGVHTWSGPVLNILFDCGMLCALYAFARSLALTPLESTVVAGTWFLSVPVIDTFGQTRPYSLFCVLSFLTMAVMMREATRGKVVTATKCILLALLTACGLLTHYLFPLVILGAIVIPAIRVGLRKPWEMAKIGASVALGGVVFVLLHPGFVAALVRQQHQRTAAGQVFRDFGGVVTRVKQTASSLSYFWYPFSGPTRYIFLAVAALLVLYVGAMWLSRGATFADKMWRGNRHDLVYAVYCLVVTSSVIVLPYLLFLTPTHAMGARYLAIAFPFFSLIPVLLFRAFGRHTEHLNALLLLGMVGVCVGSYGRGYVLGISPKQDELARWLSSDRIVVDNAARGCLANRLFSLRADADVFVADQGDIEHRLGDVSRRISSDTIWISVEGNGNTPEKGAELVNTLARCFAITQEKVAEGDGWATWRLSKKAGKNGARGGTTQNPP